MDKFFETNPKYHEGFVVQEYGGQFSLIAARKYTTKDGEDKIAQTWGDVEVGKLKTKKRLPMAVNLGSDPAKVLTELLAVLSPGNYKPDDEIPF
jgi:hypothetical protein